MWQTVHVVIRRKWQRREVERCAHWGWLLVARVEVCVQCTGVVDVVVVDVGVFWRHSIVEGCGLNGRMS